MFSMFFKIISFCGIIPLIFAQYDIFGKSHSLPTAVRLGGAIVAAVEEDAEQEELLFSSLNDTNLDESIARGKYHKQKKMMKYIYPLAMGILLAKSVIIPLLLKLLTVISTSSFVMSKISLVASALLALKWIISGNGGSEAKERLEIIQLPVLKGLSTVETDSTWSDSNFYDAKYKKYRHNYIPLAGATKGISFTAATNNYRYPQHNYNYNSQQNDGKPFL